MRCKNCGYNNADGAPRCEKCNESLVAPEAAVNSTQAETERIKIADTLKGILRQESNDDTHIANETIISGSDPELSACPQCNYLVRKGAESCPNCHYNITGSATGTTKPVTPSAGNITGTVHPYEHQKSEHFYLTPVPRVNELEFNKIEYKGEKIELSRENLEADNNTITSKVQAVIELIDGKWYISDRSRLKTTFIRVTGPVELKPGDVLLLGDRQFIFEQ